MPAQLHLTHTSGLMQELSELLGALQQPDLSSDRPVPTPQQCPPTEAHSPSTAHSQTPPPWSMPHSHLQSQHTQQTSYNSQQHGQTHPQHTPSHPAAQNASNAAGWSARPAADAQVPQGITSLRQLQESAARQPVSAYMPSTPPAGQSLSEQARTGCQGICSFLSSPALRCNDIRQCTPP